MKALRSYYKKLSESLPVCSSKTLRLFRRSRRSFENAQEIITKHFPGRFSMVCGDSKETVPKYAGKVFDVIHIDGGHDYETALKDMQNMKSHAHTGTHIILDDCGDTGIPEVNRAWKQMIETNQISTNHCEGSKNSCRGFYVM